MGLISRVAADGKELPPFDAESAARERQLADPEDASQPLEARARAYLQANCGHCDVFGGGGAVELRLQFPVSVAEMQVVGVRPARGNFGLPDACIIKAGDPLASTLYFRMAKFGRDRMPHLGSERPDEAGLKLIEQWIAGMSAESATAESPISSQPLASLLSDAKGAEVVARRLGLGELQPAEREKLLATAAKLPAGPVRDLFEGYLPPDEKGRRLGSSPRPGSILSLHGDRDRGEKLYWSTAVNCGSCHKIGDRGTAVGPELTEIGKKRTRDDVLESMLEP